MIDEPNERPVVEADARLGELMLYVAICCEGDANFGSTKLNKILFYADFIAYVRNGAAITGAEYQKLEHGPAPRRLKPVERALVERHDAVVADRRRFAHVQQRLIPLREPDLDLFTGSQIAIVDEVIAALKNHNAAQVSELSHQFPGWQLAELGETIPYYTALIPDDDWQPDEEALRVGAELAAKL
jgi:hypothetical protein